MGDKKILIIEDDADIRELIRYHLIRDGYRVLEAAGGRDGLELARSEAFDLILLDLMLPELGGLDVCRALKSYPKIAGTPIIMVTAKGEEADIVVGLELGADDYIVKPFSPRVLMARIRSVLRRKETPSMALEGEVLRIANLTIHQGKHEVRVDDDVVELTKDEFRILQFLASKPGWVFTRYQIVDAVKGEDYAVTDRAVDVQIVHLRKKLGPCGKFIETVRGVGYRFTDLGRPVEE